MSKYDELVVVNYKLKEKFSELKKTHSVLKSDFNTITQSKAYTLWQNINTHKKKVKQIVKEGRTYLLNNFNKVHVNTFSNNEPLLQTLSSKFEQSYQKSSLRVPFTEYSSAVNNENIKLIAFYFPQFHPFSENEKFWGKGFTEWINTTKSMPLFLNHYQPRLPDELGFYDTRIREVLRDQIRIAKNYGIHGFCFHHYWFMGKPVMRAPYNHIIADKNLDIPFCLHWANEPWTVRWDGFAQSGVLLDQHHTPDDDMAFIKDIIPALSDKRYIRINNRPLLIIYRPSLFPDIKATIKRWNDYCVSKKIGKLYLACMQTSFEGMTDPRTYGFDAAIEYPPHHTELNDIQNRFNLFYRNFKGHIFDFNQAVTNTIAKKDQNYTWFRGVLPDWDCTPRRINPDIMVGSTPDTYQYWLDAQIRYTKNRYDSQKRFVFINAWNEWAEGAYLEPDRKWGYSYLKASRFALVSSQFRVAIVAHIYHEELIEEYCEYFNNIPFTFDLYISTKSTAVAHIKKVAGTLQKARKIEVRSVVNKGRDIGPFLVEFKNAYPQYDLVCFVHSKKNNTYNKYGQSWRKYLLSNLLGSSSNINTILDYFSQNQQLGFVYTSDYPSIRNFIGWGQNFEKATKLAKKLHIQLDKNKKPVYPSGSMFWFRPKALKSLFDLNLDLNDFEDKSENMVDGTLAHAIERLFLYVVTKNKYKHRQVLFAPTETNVLIKNTHAFDLNQCLYKSKKIAVVLHLYYVDLIEEFITYLNNIPLQFDLYISTPIEHVLSVKKKFSSLQNVNNLTVKDAPNIGFDIAPFISFFQKDSMNYDLVLKIHGKKSIHNPGHSKWRRHLLDNLLGSDEIVKSIISEFYQNKDIGVVLPKTYSGVDRYNVEDPWRNNWLNSLKLADRLNIHIVKDRKVDFPSGSMFWFRPEALKPLFDLNLKLTEFNPGGNSLDGTLAHAIERLFLLICKKGEYDYKFVLFEKNMDIESSKKSS